MSNLKIKAHVPTQQYGFIEISGTPEDKAEIERLYNEYAESPIAFKRGTTKRLPAFVGGEIDYDEVNHIYSWNGEKYLSGSEYASKRKKPFDSVLMSGIAAKKTNSDPLEIAKLWELGGRVSREFGTNVHQALEVYGKYQSLCKTLEKEYHIPNHPILKTIIESFYVGRENEKAEYEVLVVDHEAKRAGCIDRLLITAPTTCIIQDFKITHKEDKEYWKDQLGFYEGILKAAGWSVLGKEIHQFNIGWKKVEV